VLVVWVGNFSGTGNPAFVGRQAAGPLLFQIIEALFAKWPWEERFFLHGHENITEVQVCALSGGLLTSNCGRSVRTWFIPGVFPIQPCMIHRQVAINPKTGRRSCPGQEHKAIYRVYEFWPSDLLKLFYQAGIPRRVPPPLD